MLPNFQLRMLFFQVTELHDNSISWPLGNTQVPFQSNITVDITDKQVAFTLKELFTKFNKQSSGVKRAVRGLHQKLQSLHRASEASPLHVYLAAERFAKSLSIIGKNTPANDGMQFDYCIHGQNGQVGN